MRFLSWTLLLLLLIVEGAMTTFPLVLVFLICLTVMKRQEWIFALAFLSGILLDSFAMRTLGISSIFLVTFLFLVLLYQRKYETATREFVFIASFIGSTVYLFIVGTNGILIQSFFASLLALIVFTFYQSVNKQTQSNDGFLKV